MTMSITPKVDSIFLLLYRTVSRIKKGLDERIGEILRPSALDIAFNEPSSPDEINDNILK